KELSQRQEAFPFLLQIRKRDAVFHNASSFPSLPETLPAFTMGFGWRGYNAALINTVRYTPYSRNENAIQTALPVEKKEEL
ncbi:MAG: hypothetical protein ACE5L7_09830, partial [Candidatus Aminicenantales bacterium]